MRRQLLEDLWQRRLASALDRYRSAKRECEQVMQAQRDLLTPFPDGQFAVRRALAVETAALVEYRRVLTIFTDLVVDGKPPPESA